MRFLVDLVAGIREVQRKSMLLVWLHLIQKDAEIVRLDRDKNRKVRECLTQKEHTSIAKEGKENHSILCSLSCIVQYGKRLASWEG